MRQRQLLHRNIELNSKSGLIRLLWILTRDRIKGVHLDINKLKSLLANDIERHATEAEGDILPLLWLAIIDALYLYKLF